MISSQSSAQMEMAVGILPILWEMEDVNPGLAVQGWNILVDIILNRLGEGRFKDIICRHAQSKGACTQLGIYAELMKGIESGHRGRAR